MLRRILIQLANRLKHRRDVTVDTAKISNGSVRNVVEPVEYLAKGLLVAQDRLRSTYHIFQSTVSAELPWVFARYSARTLTTDIEAFCKASLYNDRSPD
jgi:hypothetical protein